ncbi:MAG TPA: ribonuclease III [Candidatus Limivicinus faecipullorum]|nr:ribonuclease III [Candidatus Limivicinus faecipullorum]
MYGFFPEMDVRDVNKISILGLAHVGDGVYELLVRSMLCQSGHTALLDLHKSTVNMVKAAAQAAAAEKLLEVLDGDELAIYKRGRNAHVHSVPKNADIGQYHAATGLEALFGWLYLQGKLERINRLFAVVMENSDHAT